MNAGIQRGSDDLKNSRIVPIKDCTGPFTVPPLGSPLAEATTARHTRNKRLFMSPSVLMSLGNVRSGVPSL